MTSDEETYAQVTCFLRELERRTNLTPEQMSEVLQEILWLHRRRKRYERWGDWFARSVISMLVAAFFAGIGWGFVQLIQSISKTH